MGFMPFLADVFSQLRFWQHMAIFLNLLSGISVSYTQMGNLENRILTLAGYCRLKVMSEELEEANTMCQQSPRMTQVLLPYIQILTSVLEELECVEFLMKKL